jgi:UDP-perosamine 4-acetyltransferase
MKVVILGAGGHAKEVLGIFLEMREEGSDVEVIGFIDEDKSKWGKIVDDHPILGDFDWFKRNALSDIRVIAAVGDNALRHRLVKQAKRMGLSFINAISPKASISPYAHIGEGVMIFTGSIVNTNAQIGNHTILNVATSVSHDSFIGQFCNLNPGARVAGNSYLEEGVFLGMGANVIQGITIGSWSVIGAGAAVIKDIPAGVTVVGVPARVVKRNEIKIERED